MPAALDYASGEAMGYLLVTYRPMISGQVYDGTIPATKAP